MQTLADTLSLQWLDHQDEPPQPALEKQELILPEESVINELRHYAQKHNILALRKICKTLEAEESLADFAELLSPLVRRYQFAQITQLLDEVAK